MLSFHVTKMHCPTDYPTIKTLSSSLKFVLNLSFLPWHKNPRSLSISYFGVYPLDRNGETIQVFFGEHEVGKVVNKTLQGPASSFSLCSEQEEVNSPRIRARVS